jgi:hypothetical protein
VVADLDGLIEALRAGGVEFVVVGGVAAVLHGAPVTTQDLDIVPRVSEENIAKLVAVLTSLDAVVRDPAGRRLVPTSSLFAAKGQALLSTKLGPLDVLGALHDGRGYEELEASAIVFDAGERSFRVMDLDTLIDVKRTAGRAKDRLMLPLLLALKSKRPTP